MYRRILLAFFVCLAAAGCGANNARVSPLPKVAGAVGVRPTVKVPKGQPGRQPRVKLLTNGSGPRLKATDAAILDVEMRVWEGNKPFMSTYDTKQPTMVRFGIGQVAPAWGQALINRPIGSRVLLVAPATQAFGAEGRSPVGVQPSDTLVLIFDILGGYPPSSRIPSARTEFPDAGISVDDAIEPGLQAGAPPTTLTTRTLVTGNGRQIDRGSKIVTQYVARQWPDMSVVESTYARGAPLGFVLEPGAVFSGWVDALIGQRAGSKVLVLVPAKEVSGKRTLGGMAVPGGKPTAFVIDILDVR